MVSCLVLMLGGSLGACTSLASTRTPQAPLAQEQQAIVEANRGYPSFADFPQGLEPVPGDAVIKQEVAALSAEQAELAQAAAELGWQTAEPMILARELADRIQRAGAAPEAVDSQEAVRDFLRRARERGQAPAPVDRR